VVRIANDVLQILPEDSKSRSQAAFRRQTGDVRFLFPMGVLAMRPEVRPQACWSPARQVMLSLERLTLMARFCWLLPCRDLLYSFPDDLHPLLHVLLGDVLEMTKKTVSHHQLVDKIASSTRTSGGISRSVS
jgi:hypothetical protein